jgi:hypothetical protein
VIRAVLLAALAAALPIPASAQTTFFPRFDFHLGAEHLWTSDVRFVWAADFGAAVEILDYGRGRATFVANYEVIMGNEFRRFDPNQGNYLLEGALSYRIRAVEVAAVFHHISRHLSDRPKRRPVDWNMLGARAVSAGVAGTVALEGRVDIRGVLKSSLVDYRWEMESAGGARFPLSSRTSLISGGMVRVVGVDDTLNRGTQVGARAEGGIRLDGGAGSVELFVAAERRVDPYPLQAFTYSWFTAGFRLRSRP